MEMHQVRYFLSVARTLNFTRAAEDCEVAQPSLSRAIKQLEAELGGELFRRERPQAILTPLGHRMLPLLTRCFESANNARALASAVKKGEAGTIRIALSATIGLDLLLSQLHELGKVFGGLALIVRRGAGPETLEFLKTGDAEVSIAAVDYEDGDSLERFALFNEGFVLRCARAHRLANRASVSLDDLRAEQFVLPRHAEHVEALAALLKSGQVQLERCHQAFSDDDLTKLVASGAGVALVPESFPDAETIVPIPVEGLDLRRTVSLFGATGRPRSAAASMLMNLLRGSDWSAMAA